MNESDDASRARRVSNLERHAPGVTAWDRDFMDSMSEIYWRQRWLTRLSPKQRAFADALLKKCEA